MKLSFELGLDIGEDGKIELFDVIHGNSLTSVTLQNLIKEMLEKEIEEENINSLIEVLQECIIDCECALGELKEIYSEWGK